MSDTAVFLAAAFRRFSKLTIKGLRLSVKSMPASNHAAIHQALTTGTANTVYFCSRSEQRMKVLLPLTRRRHATVFSTTEGGVKQGATIAIVMTGNSPRIVVSIGAAAAHGLSLSSRVLRLAKRLP
jgi:hypothetical protein